MGEIIKFIVTLLSFSMFFFETRTEIGGYDDIWYLFYERTSAIFNSAIVLLSVGDSSLARICECY